MAVIIPFSGETPDAIAKAIESGSATIPTIIPATISVEIVFFEIPCFINENNLGVNSGCIIKFN